MSTGLTAMQDKRPAHTLFLDFVGYSRLPATAQAEIQKTLQDLVQSTDAYKIAVSGDGLILRKTGDGMALCFFDNPDIHEDIEFPVRCAIELDAALKHQAIKLRERIGSPFRLRMGIHSAPVVILETNGEQDVAGEGINLAQRVMDCGDEGHILVSANVAEEIKNNPLWQGLLHDLGRCRVKHDYLIHLYNLHGVHHDGAPLGNEALPKYLHDQREQVMSRAERELEMAREERRTAQSLLWQRGILGVIGIAACAGVFLWVRSQAPQPLVDAKAIKRVGEVVAEKKAEREAQKNAATPAPGTITATPAANAATVLVPDLKGLSQADAMAKVTVLGLRLQESTRTPAQHDTTIPRGAVLSQSPAAGAAPGADKTVYVVLSLGTPPITNPTQPQNVYTGVVIDVSVVTRVSSPTAVTIISESGDALYPSVPVSASTQPAGANPLRLIATHATAQGVVLPADALAQLQALPPDIRSKVVATGQ